MYLREKLSNALALDYPGELLEIVVSSDGSTDRTNEIVLEISDPRLVLKAFTDRLGKTACLNRVVAEARGEIVIFTDANSIFPQDLVRNVVGNFADKDIGLVTGWTKYTDVSGSNETTGLYTRIEKITKYCESLVASCVGADGAVFAMRKNLYRPLRDDDINDFVIPLHVIEQGKRVVLDPEALCWELSTTEAFSEYRRQVRITQEPFELSGATSVFLILSDSVILHFFFFPQGASILGSLLHCRSARNKCFDF